MEMKNLPEDVRLANSISKKLFIRGFVVCVTLGSLWIATEPFCSLYKDAQFLKYLFTHGLWHIGMSYGLSLIMIYYTFIECTSRGHVVHYARGSDVFCRRFTKCDCCCKEYTIDKIIQYHKIKKNECSLLPILFVKNPEYEVVTEITIGKAGNKVSNKYKSHYICKCSFLVCFFLHFSLFLCC